MFCMVIKPTGWMGIGIFHHCKHNCFGIDSAVGSRSCIQVFPHTGYGLNSNNFKSRFKFFFYWINQIMSFNRSSLIVGVDALTGASLTAEATVSIALIVSRTCGPIWILVYAVINQPKPILKYLVHVNKIDYF